MLFRKKKAIAIEEPKTEPQPVRLTQEEWKEVAEIKGKIAAEEDEESKRPQLKDFVRILINRRIGQVVDGAYPPPTNQITYYPIAYIPPENELEIIRERFNSRSNRTSYFNNFYKYAVRLKNGYIIRELRPWEIEKITDR